MNREALERFLKLLSPDIEEAGRCYTALQEKLIHFFRLKGVSDPVSAADETLDRAALKIDAGAVVPDATAALLDKTAMPAAGAIGTAAGVVPPSFAALLATQGSAAAAKDDHQGTVVDAASSPMPLAHAPDLGNAVPVVQVQATQAATTPQFAQELGEQIAWMGSGQIKEARIKLHPEELGSMDVRVHLDAGKVNVAILAQHPAAVHAVQQTLAQLDSMLAHHGLSLGQADVGQRQGGETAEGRGDGSQGQGADTGAAGATEAVATSSVSRSLLDEIA